MKTFGTAGNHDFEGVEETGILVTIADIYPNKKEWHIRSYKKYPSLKRIPFNHSRAQKTNRPTFCH
jgi:hypothetical protein